MNKRIVIISAVFPPEPVTSATLNYDLAKELAKEHNVTVIRPKPTRPIGAAYDSHEISDKSFFTYLVDSYTHPESSFLGRFRESIDFGHKSVEYIDAHHTEIDFVYNDGWQLFGLYLVAKTCVKYNIPYIVPIQDIYPECLLTKGHFPGFIKKIIKKLLMPIDTYYQKHAAKVRTISNEMADYLSKTRNIERQNYLVVNNWQNDEDFLKEICPPQNEKIVFAYVGSINVHANVDLMIRAFSEAKIPNSEFKIYGGGNQKEACQNLVRDLGLDNVSFDFVSRHQIPEVQASADVLMLALPEGNGNLCLPSKLTSYMMSGKPVLASVDMNSATKRILESEGCGIVVPPDKIEGIIKALTLFANMSREELNAMGKKSKCYAQKHLTRNANLSLVVNEINKILK